MKSSVIIKGNKYGFQIVLNPTLPFEELLHEVAVKFKESTGFFDFSRPIAVSFEGRNLTQGEQNLLVDTITENSGLKIHYIIDGAKAVETQFAQLISEAEEEKRQEETEEEMEAIIDFPENRIGKNGQFYRGTLRSGQVLESESSIIILGDVNPGAKVVAKGNIVVLGALRGTAYAGVCGNPECFVAAVYMDPIQIRIADAIGRKSDGMMMYKKIDKNLNQPMIAQVENQAISLNVISKGMISGF